MPAGDTPRRRFSLLRRDIETILWFICPIRDAFHIQHAARALLGTASAPAFCLQLVYRPITLPPAAGWIRHAALMTIYYQYHY